jgi:hypothetical protein
MAAVPRCQKSRPAAIQSGPLPRPCQLSNRRKSPKMSFRPPACPLRAHLGRHVCPLARVPPARSDSPAAPAATRPRARPATTTSPDASQDLAMIEEKDMFRAQRPPGLRGSPVIAAGAGGQEARPGGQDHRIRALTRSGAVARPARRILVASRGRRCGTRTPVSRCRPAGPAGDQRLAASHRTRAARVAGTARAGLPVTGPAAQEAGTGTCLAAAQALCRRTWPVPSPAAIRRGGVPGEDRPSAPRRGPAGRQPGLQRMARHDGPAIPVPRSPAYRQAARRGSGTGAGAPTTARIPRVYLPSTSHGPDRETAGQRRI